MGGSESGHIRIGYEADFAPLTFLQEGEPRGLVIEILVHAFARTGHGTEFVSVPLPDQERSLQAGEIDAIAFKAAIPDRAGSLDFSIPLATSGGAWFSKGGVSARERPVPGSRVATPGTGPLLAQLRRDHPDLVYPDVDTYAESLTAVVDGEADCAALNFHVGRFLASRDHPGRFTLPDAPFEPLALALAVEKNENGPMLGVLDAALAELRSDGTLEAFEARWIGG